MGTKVDQELSRALTGLYTASLTVDLDTPHRFIIFSDQHKGAGDGADEFRLCRAAYEAALTHYRDRGFTLVLLGDVEELWEQGFGSVRSVYDAVLRLEGSFPPGRYYRIWGNHDDEWMSDRKVRRRLAPYMPTAAVHEALRLEILRSDERLGTMLLLHGHQGTVASDKFRWIARLALRPYRYLQRWFGIGKQTPARDACLRGELDRAMYEWAVRQDKLMLVAGHTHRPVWSSRTHLQQLEAQLDRLRRDDADPDALAAVQAGIDKRLADSTPCEDTDKPVPCYFNAGCCKFSDGDITGLELENGILRLVKWRSRSDPPDRHELETGRVADVLAALP